VPPPPPAHCADLGNTWILHRLDETTATVRTALDGFRLDEACAALYSFTWHELCDWYIEWTKPALYARDPASARHRDETRAVLRHVVEQTLRLLHPVIPFLTEELWQALAWPAQPPAAALAAAPYPALDPARRNPEAAARFQLLRDLVGTVRSVRAEYSITPSTRLNVRIVLVPEAADAVGWLLAPEILVRAGNLCGADLGTVAPDADLAGHAIGVAGKLPVAVPLAGIVDVAAERVRHDKELHKVGKEVEGLEKRLANQEFIAKAPAEVVEEMRERLRQAQDRGTQIAEAIKRLSQLV
jgi:valyl-tRNA synthetase